MVRGSLIAADAPAWVRYDEPAGRWVLLATVLGSALPFVDATVVNVALPRIGASLGADAAGLQWTVNGYTLSLASLLLLGGALGDRFGRRRIFVLGVAWFGAASMLCGLAPSIGALVAARVLQGVGGALLTPGALAILESSFRPEDRAKAIGAWSGLGGIAGAVGPLVGGFLVQVASWRLIFYVNVPIAVVTIAVAVRHVPETRAPGPAPPLDLVGVVAGVAGLGGLIYGFTAWPSRGLDAPSVILPLAAGVIAMGAFVLVERRSRHPMLPLGLFASRTFAAANLVTFAVYAALGGVFLFVVMQLQVVGGFTPMRAGMALLPVTALMLALSVRAGTLAQRIGPRLPMTVGPLVCAGAMGLLARLGAGASYGRDVLPAVVLLGLGLSLTVAPLTATAVGAVDEGRAGIASGVNNAVARAASLLAVAVLPLAAGLGDGSLTDAATLAPVYRTAMAISAGLLLAGAAAAWWGVPSRVGTSDRARAPARAGPLRFSCAIGGPPLQPVSTGRRAASRA